MEYTKPTTKEEMYQMLQELFFYYRIRRQTYQDVTLDPITISKIILPTLDETQLLEKAQALNAGEQYKYKVEYVANLNAKLNQATAKLANVPTSQQARISRVNYDFDQSVQKLTVALSKNGLSGSSIAVDKLTQMEVERNRLISEIQADCEAQSVELRAEIATLNGLLNGADEYCLEKEEKENLAKQLQLSDEQDKLMRETYKYNNSLDEKEQRYANTIKQVNANLELKFLAIQAGEFTKDQLIEMGYYKDVINCVCDYYDTVSPLTAAQQIREDRKIIEYLDDFYESVLYMYQERAIMNS